LDLRDDLQDGSLICVTMDKFQKLSRSSLLKTYLGKDAGIFQGGELRGLGAIQVINRTMGQKTLQECEKQKGRAW